MQRGITVTNTPGVLTEDTADMTMALILAVPRRLVEGAAVLTAETGSTAGRRPGCSASASAGKRLGIVGMGRIGQAVARRAKAFGLQIHYHNRKPVPEAIEEELEATYWESLDQMLARMDIVSVNCPHTPATYHLLSARRLKLMKPDGLYRQHRARRGDRRERAGAHAGSRRASPAPASTCSSMNRRSIRSCSSCTRAVVLLPHMGSATIEGRIDMGEKVIINIKTFVDGHKPPDRVLPSML